MNKGGWTVEAVIGVICLAVAVITFAVFLSIRDEFRPLVPDSVVQTRVADMLTHIPSQTPWVVTATITPTPIQKVGGR